MNKSLKWCGNYLESQGFWCAASDTDFGYYCFGDNDNTVAISINCKNNSLHISAMKFPEWIESPSYSVHIEQAESVKSMLDVLIFTIKQYEQ